MLSTGDSTVLAFCGDKMFTREVTGVALGCSRVGSGVAVWMGAALAVGNALGTVVTLGVGRSVALGVAVAIACRSSSEPHPANAIKLASTKNRRP
jgi:hypothetical protein